MDQWIMKRKEIERLGPVNWVKAHYILKGESKTFAFLEVPNGVHVLAKYGDRFALIKQFRPATGGYVYELPGGGVEPGETVLDAAIREMKEEIGLVADSGVVLGKCRPSLAFSNEITWLVYLEGISLGPQHLDWDEDIEVFWVTLQELEAMLLRGTLEQASAVVALWYYKRMLAVL